MTIKDVVSILDATIYTCEDKLDTPLHSACGSDMMSDVLAYVKDQTVLLTGLVNPQAVRTALMMDMKCICFVRGKVPNQAILDIARENDLVVLSTQHKMFSACGLLYSNGLGSGCNG